MKITFLFIAAFLTLVVNCSAASSSTFTFDECISGSRGSSFSAYALQGVVFDSEFVAVDHMNSEWGVPHSARNVLTFDGLSDFPPSIYFGDITPSCFDPQSVSSVGAYFSTQAGAMVRITAYHYSSDSTVVPVTSVVIGGLGEAWNNNYVTLDSSNGVFEMLTFEGVNSSDDLRRFCLDDLTVTPVPEPSSILALFGGLAGVGGVALRRRTRNINRKAY